MVRRWPATRAAKAAGAIVLIDAAQSIAELAAAGTEVTYCVITDGDAGGFDPTVPRSEIPGIRRGEQRAAAAARSAVRALSAMRP